MELVHRYLYLSIGKYLQNIGDRFHCILYAKLVDPWQKTGTVDAKTRNARIFSWGLQKTNM